MKRTLENNFKWIIFLLVILLSNMVFALRQEDIDFGPTLEIQDLLKENVGTKVLNDKELSFKIILTNSLKEWVCWKSWNYRLEINKIGTSQSFGIQNSLEGEECLQPNSKKEIMVLFEGYNQLKDDERLGKWTIQPSAEIRDVTSQNQNGEKSYCCSSAPFKGNVKEFTVVKEELSTNPELSSVLKFFDSGWKIIGSILAAIILICSAIAGIRSLLK